MKSLRKKREAELEENLTQLNKTLKLQESVINWLVEAIGFEVIVLCVGNAFFYKDKISLRDMYLPLENILKGEFNPYSPLDPARTKEKIQYLLDKKGVTGREFKLEDVKLNVWYGELVIRSKEISYVTLDLFEVLPIGGAEDFLSKLLGYIHNYNLGVNQVCKSGSHLVLKQKVKEKKELTFGKEAWRVIRKLTEDDIFVFVCLIFLIVVGTLVFEIWS